MRLIKWRGILIRARKRGYFTEANKASSQEWNECAIGEKHSFARIPLPDIEFNLGCNFAMFVEYNDFKQVLKTIKKIEALPA